MQKAWVLGFVCVLLWFSSAAFAQNPDSPRVVSVEYAEDDGVPVLLKHLPDWENARNRATFTNNVADLREALGDRPIFDLVDFTGGTEAVTAPYQAGRLLIIEYSTPQAAAEADAQFRERLASLPASPPIYYRRIGNYGAFVFDATDEAAANSLFDQVKYEKTVQWIYEDPYYQQKAERYLARTTAEIFLSTALAVVIVLGTALLTGIVAGLVFFRVRQQKRSSMAAFSDAGGMVRLNLDDLTSPTSPDRLLND